MASRTHNVPVGKIVAFLRHKIRVNQIPNLLVVELFEHRGTVQPSFRLAEHLGKEVVHRPTPEPFRRVDAKFLEIDRLDELHEFRQFVIQHLAGRFGFFLNIPNVFDLVQKLFAVIKHFVFVGCGVCVASRPQERHRLLAVVREERAVVVSVTDNVLQRVIATSDTFDTFAEILHILVQRLGEHLVAV